MDGLVIVVGAGVLLVTLVVCAGMGLTKLAQRYEQRYPDPMLLKIGSFVRPGCEFDRQKYLACQLRRAHRQLLLAQQRYRDLHACLHPAQEILIQREAAIRSGAAPSREFSVNSTFYRGQVRAALRRVQ